MRRHNKTFYGLKIQELRTKLKPCTQVYDCSSYEINKFQNSVLVPDSKTDLPNEHVI